MRLLGGRYVWWLAKALILAKMAKNLLRLLEMLEIVFRSLAIAISGKFGRVCPSLGSAFSCGVGVSFVFSPIFWGRWRRWPACPWGICDILSASLSVCVHASSPGFSSLLLLRQLSPAADVHPLLSSHPPFSLSPLSEIPLSLSLSLRVTVRSFHRRHRRGDRFRPPTPQIIIVQPVRRRFRGRRSPSIFLTTLAFSSHCCINRIHFPDIAGCFKLGRSRVFRWPYSNLFVLPYQSLFYISVHSRFFNLCFFSLVWNCCINWI